MSVPVRLGAEPLELIAWDGKLFTLTSARAFAPGQPMALTVDLNPPCGGLDLKSIGSRKRDDGRFEVRARAMTLAKSTRERLETVFSGAK
jgi:hypothetical protein